MYMALYARNFIYMKENFPFSGCTSSSGYLTCTGMRTFVAPYAQYWYLTAGFDCYEKQGLNINVMFNLTYFEDFKIQCTPFHNTICDGYVDYSHTSYPNILGQPTEKEANEALALILNILQTEESCYKYTLDFVCRIFIPKCRDGEMIYPCKQMCLEGKEACSEIIRKWEQSFFCMHFRESLNSSECFYKPVTCPMLDSPQFGEVLTSGLGALDNSTYRCNSGFRLEGDEGRTCLYTGLWNGTAPVCKPVTNMKLFVIISVLVLLIVIIVIACLYYRNTIKLLILHNVQVDAIRLDNFSVEKRLFVTFSSQDLKQVDNVFLPRLRHELPRWKIQTYQQDFVAGHPLLECMREGVWESQAVLVLLTENFVASPMCMYEFTEARTRRVTDKTFKLILILFKEECNDAVNVDGLSNDLKRYIVGRVYLRLGEVLFWNKLRRALAT